MIPFVEVPELRLGPLSFPVFPLLACAGVVVGFEWALRAAPRFGQRRDVAGALLTQTLLLGFVGSHVFAVAAYAPERMLRDPLVLLRIWGSMSAFGGILAGLGGAWLAMGRRKLPLSDRLRFFDLLAHALPPGWILGRAGCALVHDHPGIRSNHPLAVRFPDGPRLDLGLLELLTLLPLAALLWAIGRRPRRPGLLLGLFLVLYGFLRLGLDALRVGEARILGWTPGQYVALLGALAGIAVLSSGLRPRGPRHATRPSEDA